MLTRRALRALLLGSLAALLSVVGVVGAPLSAQAADDCTSIGLDGTIHYTCGDDGGTTPGTPGDPGGHGTTQPTCDLVDGYTFCQGTVPCRIKDIVTPYAPPPGDPPEGSTRSDWHVVECLGQLGIAVWDAVAAPVQPPAIVLARRAFGELAPPASSLAFNPAQRTLVSVPTWFYAPGLTDGVLRGTAAFGMVAIAEPSSLEVVPGDGSGSFGCAFTASADAACAHTYGRSSVGQPVNDKGLPSFGATATAHWTVRFEQNGVGMNIPGAPTELVGPAMNAAVPVAEVQSVVQGN